MLETIVRYFDLQSERRPPERKAHDRGPAAEMKGSPSGRPKMSAPAPAHASVLPQYGAVSLGVLVEPFLTNAVASGNLNLDFRALLVRVGFALLIAIVLLPAVYKNAFDPDKPMLVQLCALFTSGVGWQSLFQAATAAGSSVATS